ncbi:hypothetical protein [Rhodovulum marinum]|nr:hypothetical protein [Rhodovulum marinum]
MFKKIAFSSACTLLVATSASASTLIYEANFIATLDSVLMSVSAIIPPTNPGEWETLIQLDPIAYRSLSQTGDAMGFSPEQWFNGMEPGDSTRAKFQVFADAPSLELGNPIDEERARDLGIEVRCRLSDSNLDTTFCANYGASSLSLTADGMGFQASSFSSAAAPYNSFRIDPNGGSLVFGNEAYYTGKFDEVHWWTFDGMTVQFSFSDVNVTIPAINPNSLPAPIPLPGSILLLTGAIAFMAGSGRLVQRHENCSEPQS